MLTHDWALHTAKSGKQWFVHNGSLEQVVAVKPDESGFLWVFKNISSYSSTVEEAKEWVETLAEAGRRYLAVIGKEAK